MSRNIRKNAFTLVELLVVVAILVLLISMLLPSMSWAMGRAKESQCSFEIKNLGTAFSNYAGDNNGFIPKSATTTTPVMNADGTYALDSSGNGQWNWGQSWETTLLKGGYVVNRGLVYPWYDRLYYTTAFICPSDQRTVNRDFLTSFFMPTCYTGGPPSGPANNLDKNVSYAHPTCAGVLDGCYHYSYYDSSEGGWVSNQGMRDAPMPHLRSGQIGEPGGTIQLIEGIGLWYYDWWDSSESWGPDMWNIASGHGADSSLWPYPSTDSSRTGTDYTRRHRKGQLALMCDGSARWVQTEDTVGPAYSKVFHGNNLSWDNCEVWYSTYVSQFQAAGIHGMWSIDVGD